MADASQSAAQPRDEYTRRLDQSRAALARAERRHYVLGYVRLVVSAVAAGIGFGVFQRADFFRWLLLGPAAGFGWLGLLLRRAESERTTLSRVVGFYERALARLDGRWAGSGQSGARFLTASHLYARDLDILGDASLFELLSCARTGIGEETLAAWLLSPAPPDAVRARQRAVMELGPKLDLREDLAVLGEDARSGVHPENLAAWAEREVILQPSSMRLVAGLVSLLGIIAIGAILAYFAAAAGALDLSAQTIAGLRIYCFLIAVIVVGFLWRFKKRTGQILHEVEEVARELGLLSGVLCRLEAESFSCPMLATLRAELNTAGHPPSRRIARLNRLVELLDSRRNAFVAILGPLVLWDLHLAYTFEDWRRTSGPALRRWLKAVGEIEALSSLAAFRYEQPGYVFPEFVDQSPYFDGEALAHPLLPAERVVANDLRIGAEARVLVVSGSNMSGKSTLLRTVGVNTVLAHAGAPVRAKRLRLSPLIVGASIRIQDSLQDGTSHFLAEITRLRLIMEQTGQDTPVLFLIDEILNGTNSHDRRIGAEAVVRGLADRDAIGLVTTHDLALARIADRLGASGANVHFEDHLTNGQMSFDYRMRPGVVQKSNAIELMRSVGLDV